VPHTVARPARAKQGAIGPADPAGQPKIRSRPGAAAAEPLGVGNFLSLGSVKLVTGFGRWVLVPGIGVAVAELPTRVYQNFMRVVIVQSWY
jgi:hypothetical protein